MDSEEHSTTIRKNPGGKKNLKGECSARAGTVTAARRATIAETRDALGRRRLRKQVPQLQG
jgi:hypothetical protein